LLDAGLTALENDYRNSIARSLRRHQQG
jgi:hypothetical protein